MTIHKAPLRFLKHFF